VRTSAPGAARLGTARIGDIEQRTRLRIALAEEQEIKGDVPGDDDEVGLHLTRGQVGRRRRQFASASLPPHFRSAVVPQIAHCQAPNNLPSRCSGLM
jgi:hypothetical protein